MAKDVTPTDFWPNYSLGTNQAIFNTSNNGSPSLPECSNTAANATTGDARTILYAILNKAYRSYIAMSAGSRPVNMTIQRNTNDNGDTTQTRQFTVTFIIADGNESLVAES